MKYEDRIKGMLYGLIVGDALGAQVENAVRGTFYVSDMIGRGDFDYPAGTWSDVSSMSLCLVENIIDEGDASDLMDKFLSFYEEGHLTPFDKSFDVGPKLIDAFMRYKLEGVAASEAGGNSYYENGNGALMRISPLVPEFIKLEYDFDTRFSKMQEITHLTHRNPISDLGCIIYLEIIRNIYLGYNKDDSLENTRNTIIEHLSYSPYLENFDSFNYLFTAAYEFESINNIKASGYIVESLEAVIFCFYNFNNYTDCILNAINLGLDTSTTGSVTGALAGSYYGIEDVPLKWQYKLIRHTLIDRLIIKYIEKTI
ncbi:ADP-ribosylglycohydrolase family protein [Mycoplasma sp. P36-A1]|uniref:ADP-ribosylglycohydrolase family protein n=1 Tax=Mycoplasma sp. P36-A1 TaxID=3252900 RepID=UPI003C2C731B